ncbi:properdin-like [Solea solea]|uniref:properdin-like n=1 Tax=Solea solea TaxID=90069 RepID=UPI00272B7906|nr:properdin-like [Solea solea]
MDVLYQLILLLLFVESSECVQCFAHFDPSSGQCGEELGEVDEDDCCQNPHYGYKETHKECQSCGPPVWSLWSSWSQCNVVCGDGVTQRSRKCFGIGGSECDNPAENLQTQACTGTCCDVKSWSLWSGWSSCSVTCGEGGVRSRDRVCSSPPECSLSCTGPSEEREACPTHTCPVHGGWSSWSTWSQCSGSCVDDQSDYVPSKVRHRSCSNPAPSDDTVPPGSGCHGDSSQVKECSELPNCPVHGSWGAWSLSGQCSASCGEGLQTLIRKCDQPAPKYGGKFCDGTNAQTNVCHSRCPVDGFWSGWSSWGDCSGSCVVEGRPPVRTRSRSCSNPAPSSSPPGRGCHGDDRHIEDCSDMPPCPVDGGWTSWSPFTSCPVTCGVGLEVSVRSCDSPASQHGGQPCPGEGRRTRTCSTHVYCPVDGAWSPWSPWNQCLYPFGGRDIRCKQIGGSQKRERECRHQDHNGSICIGGSLTETRVCYDVSSCYVKGSWDTWDQWSLCTPACGGNSKRFRRRICDPDFSDYRPLLSRLKEKATFFGIPRADCGSLPDGEAKFEIQPCVNVPPCPTH